MSRFDEEPDADIHGECAEEIALLNKTISELRATLKQTEDNAADISAHLAAMTETARKYRALAQKEAAAPGDLNAAIMALPRYDADADGEMNERKHGEYILLSAAAELARAALAQPVAGDAPTCKWMLDDYDSGTWASSCGELWSFVDGGPQENRVSYCHHCGVKVAIDAQDGEATT